MTAVWLGILTLAVLLLTRQLGIILQRMQEGAADTAFVAQGLPVGARVSEELRGLLEAAPASHYLLLVTTSCQPCRSLVNELAGVRIVSRVLTLIPGESKMANEMAVSLGSSFSVVQDPEATKFADEMRLRATPYIIEITDGVITRKSFVQGATDFAAFIGEGQATVDPNDHVGDSLSHINGRLNVLQ